MFGGDALRHGQRSERREADRHQHQRLVGHEIEEGEDDQRRPGAGAELQDDTPLHMMAPQPGAPAIGRDLDDTVEHHGDRHRQEQQQEADQQHPARHAEDPGNERGHDGHDRQSGQHGKRKHRRAA
jgi:hypothetical protein